MAVAAGAVASTGQGRPGEGESGGYYPLGFDTGVSIQPLKNTSPELNSEIQQVVEDLQAGTITVNKDTTPIEAE